MNDKLGEIWYELDLVAEENPPIKLKPLISEIGKVENSEI
jgi:hypothetical protein